MTILPESLGGLGLCFESDVNNIIKHMLKPTALAIMADVTYEGNSFLLPNIVRDIRKFLKNSTFRGYDVTKEMEEEIRQLAPSLQWYCKSKGSFAEYVVKENLVHAGMSARMMFTELYKRGIMPIDQAIDRLMRPILNLRIFSSEVKANAFNTEDLRKRYSRIWNLYQENISDRDLNVTREDLVKSIEKNEKIQFFDFSMKSPVESDLHEGAFMRSVIDQFDLGAPSLLIPSNMMMGELPELPKGSVGSAYNEQGFLYTDDSPFVEFMPPMVMISTEISNDIEEALENSSRGFAITEGPQL
jgi:hypothetical protein